MPAIRAYADTGSMDDKTSERHRIPNVLLVGICRLCSCIVIGTDIKMPEYKIH